MNKKGFTLIELMISISLLSIVLIFMMNTLVKLRDTSLASGEETNLLVGQAMISKTINNDIILNGGVKNYECLDNRVTLTLMTNKIRYIELNETTSNLEENMVITYRNPGLSEAILVRKLDDKYSFDKFVCEQISEDISRIRINFKEKENNNIVSYSEIFITKLEEYKSIIEILSLETAKDADGGVIDYGQTSVTGATNGLYYTEEGTEGNERVYFYRGAVENNYLVFGNYCWRIVRTVEDGSVRLRYGGEATKNADNYICPQTGTAVNIATSQKYSESTSNKSYVDYKTSSIKTVVEDWYRDNIAPNSALTDLIKDTSYCGDMSERINGSSVYFGAYDRVHSDGNNTYNPQYKCPSSTYAYTVAKGDLNYPVALLTADEIVYAGGLYNTSNENYFLRTGKAYWTMTPTGFYGNIASVFNVGTMGGIGNTNVATNFKVLPVISIKEESLVKSGTGLYNDPYIIITPF